jgi:hypothetical protein
VLSNIVRKQYPLEVWNVPFRALCKKPHHQARATMAMVKDPDGNIVEFVERG